MSKSDLREFVDFVPAQLTEGKEWYVYYYVKHPTTQEFIRKKIKCNRINSVSERRKFARTLVAEINDKLRRGWNPFISADNSKSFYLVSEALNVYENSIIRLVKSNEMRPATLRTYKSYIKFMREWLTETGNEQMYMINFTKKVAKEFLQSQYDRGLSGRTYNNYLIGYRAMFNWFVNYDYCKVNPFSGIVKKHEKGKQRIQFFDIDTRNKIRDHLEKNNYNFMVCCLLAYHALIRPKEITFLKIKNIDFNNGQIHISGEYSKNKKDRHPTIPTVLIDELKRLNLQDIDPNHYLFSYGLIPGNIRLDERRIAKYWDKLRNDLNLPKDYKFYSLRDSGIIHLIQKGVPLNEVMEQADHSSLEITSVYAKSARPQILKSVRDNSAKF